MVAEQKKGKYISPVFFDRKKHEWQHEVDKIQTRLTKHINANDSYIEEGARLLELVQHAVITYKNLKPAERGSFLKIVHSNSTWRDGKLHHEYRQPFDFMAEINNEFKQKKAVFPEKNDPCLLWLGYLDSNQEMAESESAALPFGYTPREEDL